MGRYVVRSYVYQDSGREARIKSAVSKCNYSKQRKDEVTIGDGWKHVMGVVEGGLARQVECYATYRKVCCYIEADVSCGESLIRNSGPSGDWYARD
jgi:hypothetical protein